MPKTIRLLVFDDSQAEADVLIHTLEKSGFEVCWFRVATTDNLQTALDAGPWDALLASHRLPESGVELTLKTVRLSLPDLPFIVISGVTGEDRAVAMMRAGANDYIRTESLARLAPALQRELREADNRRAKHAAGVSTDLLAAIVNSCVEAVISSTLEGVVTTWNPAAEQLYGWRAAEAIGQNISMIIPGEKASEWALVTRRLCAGESVGCLETIRVHRDGHRIAVALTTSPVRSASGELVGVSNTAMNVRRGKQTEQELCRSEAKYRGLIESIPAIVWLYGASGKPLLYNHHWYDYTGQTSADTAADRWYEALHPDDVARALAIWKRCKATGQAYTCEFRIRRSDGAYRWFLSQGTARHGSDGIEWAGICTDIEDKQRAEEGLRKSASLLTAVVEGTPDAVFVKDMDGRYLLANPAAARYMGRLPADVLGNTDARFFDPKSAELLKERDRQVIDSGQTEMEEEELTVGGVTRTFLATKSPFRDTAGNVIGVIRISRDISDRKRTADALSLRDRAIGAATQGLLITDPAQPDNPLIYVSPGFERITGYSAQEALGRNCRFLQGPETDPVEIGRLREAISAKESCTVELLNYRRDGSSFWNELSISPVLDGAGKLTHFVGMQMDVTARRSLEEQFRQAQKMEAVGHLAGGVAHDFNNLLTVINGYSDLLLQTHSLDDRTRDMIREIYKAGERSAGLTRQLLMFSRQQVLAPRMLDLNESVNDTQKMLRRLIGEDIELVITLLSDLWVVRADPGQIEQVLMNLAINAQDAMNRGGCLTIETQNTELDQEYVRVHPGARAGRHALLSISDTGSGMSAEVKKRIFEPFFTTKAPGKGTGLGLATVYGIIKQSGGHVAVYSELGIGTTFKVYLPAVERATGLAVPGSLHIARPHGTETILLAEDEAGVRAMTRYVLTECGYTVLETAEGDEAIRVAAAFEGVIHLLITDVVMPGTGGRAVAEKVAGWFPDLRVLFVSGYTDDAVIRHGVLREGADFLQKPFTPLALTLKVRQILDGKSPSG